MMSRISIVIRLMFILTCSYGATYLVLDTDYWLAGVWLVLFAVAAVFNLIRFLERSKRELHSFLEAIKQGDFSQSTNRKIEDKKYDFRKVYKEIADIFHRLNAEKASNHIFLQTVIEHVNIAIIAYNEHYKVAISNQAIRQLFHVPHFQGLDRLLTNHPELINDIKDEKQKEFIYKMLSDGQLKTLSVKKSFFKIKDENYTIVSFQDIRPELEEKELDSWQKLIRVLTHEIMNSAIPISTLASVISHLMLDDEKQLKRQISDEEKQDIFSGLNTIENRSKGLSKFVESYKNLTQLKPLQIESIRLDRIIEEALTLLRSDLDSRNIQVSFDSMSVEINADQEMLSQVFINLIKNASEAIKQRTGLISIDVEKGDSSAIISISDNGAGIEPEILEDIFITLFHYQGRRFWHRA